MSNKLSAAERFYGPITEGEVSGIEGWEPKSFRPSNGRILVVMPPELTHIGTVLLPERSQEPRGFGRVAAVPGGKDHLDAVTGDVVPGERDPKCPCQVGDWVLLRASCGLPVKFGGRKDLILVDYTDDVASNILGILTGGRDLDVIPKE